jgi:neural Wiskott-Aldrich syndrome protein
MASHLPPLYSRQDATQDKEGGEPAEIGLPEESTQLIIAPANEASQFQMGQLGAPGERAAIEGEIQIKGAHEGIWERVLVTFANSPPLV